jgi:hypothetical protein
MPPSLSSPRVVSQTTQAAKLSFSSIIKRSVLVLGCVAALPGCATLMSDDHQSIVVTSDPLGAACQVRQGGSFVASVSQTPGTILVSKSRHDIAIDCERAGYYPGAAVLQPEFQGWTFGNILYGGSIGLLVDTSTSAVNQYPHWVQVLMKPLRERSESRAERERLSEIDETRRQALQEGLTVQ